MTQGVCTALCWVLLLHVAAYATDLQFAKCLRVVGCLRVCLCVCVFSHAGLAATAADVDGPVQVMHVLRCVVPGPKANPLQQLIAEFFEHSMCVEMLLRPRHQVDVHRKVDESN